MKRCSSCKVTFENPSEHFNKCRSRKDGFDNRCRVCKRKEQKTSYATMRSKRYQARLREIGSKMLTARDAVKKVYKASDYKCSVLNCSKTAEDLHHVTYDDYFAVVPLCRPHHKMDHQTVKETSS